MEGLLDAVARCASAAHPFTVELGGGGGAHGRSEVAWLGLAAGQDGVIELADRFDELLPSAVRASLRPTRPAPHLTIARRVPAALVAALTDQRQGGVHLGWEVDRIVLFRSHTGTPAGSRYEALAESRLGAPMVA
jgi:2'-5' RNA ligase